ncbi:MAG: hypothetical protein JW738_04635 [Actinobacteria bacterium]|nr:hypothetical protein [Actinomycetota bacterium]
MKVHLEEIKGDYTDDVTFEEIDISRDLSIARQYGVQVSPTVIIVDNASGKVLSTTVGPQPKTYFQAEIEDARNK